MNNTMKYQDFSAAIEYSAEGDCLIGQIADISLEITFRGDSVQKIRQAFEQAVDDYLADCAAKNEEPEKPLVGPCVVRISPALHQTLALAAQRENKSLSQWIAEVRKKTPGAKD